ncbi:hypothetical protein SRHO_G00157260, partial [Serrasalmus rhombeus]
NGNDRLVDETALFCTASLHVTIRKHLWVFFLSSWRTSRVSSPACSTVLECAFVYKLVLTPERESHECLKVAIQTPRLFELRQQRAVGQLSFTQRC